MTHPGINSILLRLCFSLLALASLSFARPLASLSGSVFDPTGAPIPSARDRNSQKFGEIVSAAAPRLIQLAARFQF